MNSNAVVRSGDAIDQATKRNPRPSTESADDCAETRDLLFLASGPLSNQVSLALREARWNPLHAATPEEALRIAEHHHPLVGLVILPDPFDETGFQQARQLVTKLSSIEWIAALGREQVARLDVRRLIVERLRDFQVLPLDPTRLTVVLGHAYGLASIGRALRQLGIGAAPAPSGMIGTSSAMRDLYATIERVASTNLPVLIRGETGTGKELAARAIHEHSSRSTGPFVALNCAAIPTSLLQSELFGHEKGAFTDACETKTGLLEAAAGGTLLLDEIGDMPLRAQTSLLRFLEDRQVTPVGGTRPRTVDVRIIAATNTDLEKGILEKTFREDLFYRLAVVTLRTPSLLEREGDLEALALHFLEQAAKRLGKRIEGLDESGLAVLRKHPWPGNLRELRAAMLQAALVCKGRLITEHDLEQSTASVTTPRTQLTDTLKSTEKTVLQQTLGANSWNIAQTSRALGVSRMTLYRLMTRHGISRPDDGNRAAPAAFESS